MFVHMVRSELHGCCFIMTNQHILDNRDLDYILSGKSTILILIYVFPLSGSLAKNIVSILLGGTS